MSSATAAGQDTRNLASTVLPTTGSDGLAFRRVDADQPVLQAWLENVALVFHDRVRPTPEIVDLRRTALRSRRLSAAFDGDQLVGTFCSWDTALTVPGGSVTADAISAVTVRPTHRRRGILSTLIRADLDDAAAAGTAVATLIASEAVIYGRFGFAPATHTADYSVDRGRAALRPEVPRAGRVDVVPEAEARQLAPRVYAAARRPGEIDRMPSWWDRGFGTETLPGDSRAVHQAAVHTADDGTPTGYVSYRVDEKWDNFQIETTLVVRELCAATPEAYAALWDYLLSVDLVATIRADERPVDEPLPWLVGDRRAIRTLAKVDFHWHRLLDPAAALSARRYERPGAATFAVVDPAGYAAGTFALEVDASGTGRCTRTDAAPDVTLPVDVLSAAWIGGPGLPDAVRAGRGRQERDGGVERLAGLLRTTAEPYSGTWF